VVNVYGSRKINIHGIFDNEIQYLAYNTYSISSRREYLVC
jgi:hypothetical protein